jgi:hypothetical protein
MQYMMLIYLDENSISEEQRNQCYLDSAGYARQLHAEGKCLAVAPLQPTLTATSIRHHEGKQVITDGPFAETREQLGGFFLINATNLDEALDIAKKIPAGRWGTVEVRPVMEISGLPSQKS